jgi:hypothetical protein
MWEFLQLLKILTENSDRFKLLRLELIDLGLTPDLGSNEDSLCGTALQSGNSITNANSCTRLCDPSSPPCKAPTWWTVSLKIDILKFVALTVCVGHDKGIVQCQLA